MTKYFATILAIVFALNVGSSQTTIMPRVYFNYSSSADHTDVLQAAIDNSAGVETLVFPSGNYYIDAIKKINIPSNSHLEWENGAIFYCIPNGATSYRIINIQGNAANGNVENVVLMNPEIVGDRTTHTGTLGEHGHGIVIGSASNIRIVNAKISNCWGDGLAIYGGENLDIKNLISDNNRRQGLTITRGRNILISNPKCINTNGTAPESGIDIEPNYPTDYLENIRVINAITENNNGSGITVGCKKLINSGTNKVVTVEIINHQDNGSAHGFSVASLDKSSSGTVSGSFRNIGSSYTNNKQNGVLIRGYSSQESPQILIEDVSITNPNSSGQSSPFWGSGIAIIRLSSDANQIHKVGNIKIVNPSITDNLSLMRRGIYLRDTEGIGMEQVEIINPLNIDGIADRERMDPNTDGVTFIDDNVVADFLYHTDINLYSRVYTRVSNLGALQKVNWDLQIARIIDAPMTFENHTTHGERLLIEIGNQQTDLIDLFGITHVNITCLESFEVGATITIRRHNANTWKIEAINGEWFNCTSTNSSITNFQVLPKVFLQGTLDMSNDLMKDDLRSNTLIPLTDPYGYGSTINPSVLSVTGTDAIVDWVLVELRSTDTPEIVAYQIPVLLQRDGDVVDVDGISAVNFMNITTGTYHVAIRHRNHLGVMASTILNIQ